MFMERSFLVDDELYGDEPREHTALNWPPPMVLPELPAAVRGPAPASVETPEGPDDEMPELHLFARAARASRGPILVLGTAVTVALSGGYAAGHAFGWKMPPRLRASVSPALTTFINEQIPALVARPGAPLWCPAEEVSPTAEPQADLAPSSTAQAKTEAAADPSAPSAFFENIDRRTISLLPRLRRPFQERERPAPPWRGVVWSPRANSLVSLSPTSGTTTLVASQPARAPDETAGRFVH
jgi:hypothetical protein